MKAKYILSIILLMWMSISPIHAQEQDTLRQTNVLSYEKMMDDMSGSVNSPGYIDNAMKGYINGNSSRKNMCYRIRIYFNNSQNARTASAELVREFNERYPSVPVYNQYVNPYFKVTVGNFRTKSDAMKFMTEIKPYYSSAFPVKESYVIPSVKN